MNDNGKENGTRDPDAILASIERTRLDMDSTLHAIEERLTPGQLVDQGLDYLRNSGGREFLSNLTASVKTNPLPATLVGIGLAWLMVSSQRSGGASFSSVGDPFDTESRDSTTGVVQAMRSTKDKVTGAMQATRERVAGTAQGAREIIGSTTERARRQVDRARDGYQRVVHEQPLALGAVGIGVGALLAASLPRTRAEDAALGPAADRVKETIADKGHEQLEKAGERIAAAGDAPARPTREPANPLSAGVRKDERSAS